MLDRIEDAATAVLTMTEGLSADELRAARLTRFAVLRELKQIVQIARDTPARQREATPEINWDTWLRHEQRILVGGREADDALHFLVGCLVPETLTWIRIYRRDKPGLFPS